VDNDYQSFDAAFEQSSGDLMVVTGYPNVNTLWYWTWSGGSWSGYQSASVPNNSSVYRWTKLAPQPGTDKIGFIGMGENIPSSGYEQTAVSVAIWNGSAWGNTSTPYSYGCNNGTDAIDIQAVRSGTYAGDLVAVWARGQYVYAKIWRENLGSWGSNTQLADLGDGKRAQWLKLKPNPNGDNLILAIGATYVRADSWTIGINVNATARTFTRASGSFLTDGFVVGDSISTSGFSNAGNNTTKIIESVSATVITVTSGTGLVNETGGGNERIKCIKTLDTGAATINVNAAGRTFTQAAGGYTANGFAVGDQIITSGFTNAGNNTVKTIQTVTDTVITVTDGTGLVNETGNANERIQRTYSLYTITYDGDSRTFGSISSALESALYGNPDYNRPFDIVWDPESGSSNVLLVYSDLWGLRYITSSDSGSSWGSEQTVTSSYQAYWVQLERVPGMMYMGIHDNADDLRTYTWAGSTWTAKNTVTTDLETGYNTNREVEGFAIGTNVSSTYKLEKHIAPLQGSLDVTTTGTNYADLGTTWLGKTVFVYWDSTKYTGATVYFEAVLKSNNASGIAYAKLYDATGAGEVANSEVSVTGTTYTRVRSGPISLTSGNQYKVIIKSNNASYEASLRASRLIVVQEASSISATETYILLHDKINKGAAYGNSPYTQSFYYDSSRFDGTVNVYFEATMMTDAGTGYARLYNNTDGAEVANSEITTTSTSMVRVRSSALTLTSGKEYTMQLKGEGNTTYITSAVLIIQQSGTITKTETHFPVITSYNTASGTSYADSYFPLYYDPGNWSRVSNTFSHQVYSATQNDTTVAYTELYNSTGTSSLEERRWSGTTWAKLGQSSPVAMPSSASTVTARQKYAGTNGTNYAASRLIVQSRTSGVSKIEKQVHLQSLDGIFYSGDTDWQESPSAYPISGIPFLWEPGNYTSPKVYFEALLATNDGAKVVSAAIFKKGATRPADTLVSESQIFSYSSAGVYERVRSGVLPLESGQEYIVKIKCSDNTHNSYINSARLIILQDATSLDKMESQPLLSPYNDTTNSSWETVIVNPLRYYYDSSQFDGTVTIFFEVGLQSYVGGGTVRAQLYNVTDSSAVSGSELTSTNTDFTIYERKRSAALTLTTGKEYMVQLKSDNGTDGACLGAARLIIQQSGTGLTKTESIYQLGYLGKTTTGSSYVAQNQLNLYEPGNISYTTLSVYHESIFMTSSSSYTAYVDLYNNDNSTSISELNTTSTTIARRRSSALTMPTSNKNLEMRVKVGSGGTNTFVGSRLIIQLTASPTVVFLSSFTATGNGKHVKVDWETASETNNLGFNLYRSTKKGGPYSKLNTLLIPGLLGSPTGRKYTYEDKKVTKGKLYYYKLEDIDLSGKKTTHGPICVDWNGDVIPDDQQSKKKSPGLSAGSSRRRPVTQASTTNSPYAEGSRAIGPETSSFTARQREDRVLLQWRSGYELNTLGYHVYREEDGEFIRVTPELVAGSALFAANALPAGNAYAWWDDLATGSREASVVSGQLSVVKYWLEEVDLSGSQTWYGPVAPVTDEALKIPECVASALLSKVGMNPSGQQSSSLSKTNALSFRVNAPGPIDLQWSLAAGSAIKLSIRERGWYRVTQAELVSAGLDPGVKPRFLQLFTDAVEQPIRVKGQGDERFGKNDFIEFYGEGLDTLSTDTRTYWLVVGQSPGKRISNVRSSRGLEDHSSVPFTVQLKGQSLYFQALSNGEDDNFFGPTIGTTPVERTLNVPYPDPTYSGNATLTVSLQGVTLKPHQVRVSLNDMAVGELVFDGKARRQLTLTVPHSTLLDGENLITLVALGQDLDISALDIIELTYQRAFTADAEELGFTLSNPGKVRIEGFSTHPIRVADVTDPEAVKLVSGAVVSRGSSGYSVRFGSHPGDGSRTFYAFSEAGIKSPAEIKVNQVSTWHHENQGADLVMIAHGNFMDSLAPLKSHRETQGYSVALIDVEDIFDEFSYGAKTPQAIKDFLTRASTSWQTPPRFVLLVGDASFDPKNYLGLGNQDFVPTKILDTEYMETASDDWFVDFNGDGLPDMAIGRLPVQTAEESAAVVFKIIAYDQAPSGDWATEALMVADLNDTYDFEGASQEVSDLLPEQMTIWSVYRGQAGDNAAREATLGSINEGKLIINYIGHGTVDLWRGGLLTAGDAVSLTNGAALPLVVGMTCLNGFFQTPYMESLAEALLKAENGGAVAIWTSSGLTVPNEQAPMNQELMRLLFNGQGLTLGEAVAQAKTATSDQDVRRSWILFGDPTMKLKR
jgi:hypothetical protein